MLIKIKSLRSRRGSEGQKAPPPSCTGGVDRRKVSLRVRGDRTQRIRTGEPSVTLSLLLTRLGDWGVDPRPKWSRVTSDSFYVSKGLRPCCDPPDWNEFRETGLSGLALPLDFLSPLKGKTPLEILDLFSRLMNVEVPCLTTYRNKRLYDKQTPRNRSVDQLFMTSAGHTCPWSQFLWSRSRFLLVSRTEIVCFNCRLSLRVSRWDSLRWPTFPTDFLPPRLVLPYDLLTGTVLVFNNFILLLSIWRHTWRVDFRLLLEEKRGFLLQFLVEGVWENWDKDYLVIFRKTTLVSLWFLFQCEHFINYSFAFTKQILSR